MVSEYTLKTECLKIKQYMNLNLGCELGWENKDNYNDYKEQLQWL